MSLKGSLQTIALSEVLQLLSTTGKSGALHVVGNDAQGRLWFADGRMSAFSVASAEEPFVAVYELLRVPQGEFSFAAGEEASADAVAVDGGADVAETLAAAEERLAEWYEILGVVPSLDHHLELAPEPNDDVTSVDRLQWALIVAVGDGRAVRDVLVRIGLDEFDGCRAVRHSVEAGLLVVHEPTLSQVSTFPPLSIVADDHPHETVTEEAAVSDAVVEADVDSLPGSILRFGVDASAEPVNGGEFSSWSDIGATAFVDADEQESPAHLEEVEVVAVGQDFADDATSETHYEAPISDPDHAAVAYVASDGDSSTGDDRYAALRAAMLEVHEQESVVVDDAEFGHVVGGYEDAPVAEHYEIGSESDGRAALEALLSEVRGEEEAAYQSEAWSGYEAPAPEVPAYEQIDGLADRGPWTEHELASMEAQTWSSPSGPADAGDVVAFGTVAEAGNPAQVDQASEIEVAEEPQAAVEEPMNRGLLLKFLSSVRN